MKLTALLLALLLALPLAVACSNNNNTSTTTVGGDNPDPADTTKYAAIAGEYLLDASNLGMPIKRYIKVSADGKFVIGTDRTYTSLKGDGTVGNSGDTYMFLYSDSTNDSPKTATFTFDGVNMVFSTSVPIGSASISPNAETGAVPVAKKLVHEDILGTYAGSYDKVSGMGGTVHYTFELVLGYGLEYTFSSSFTMMGTSMTLTESGSFAVDGEKITFTATEKDGEAVAAPTAVEGTIVGKKITAAFKLSAMASAAETVEMNFATYADIAGTYTGVVSLMGGMATYAAALELDAFGGYVYVTVDEEEAIQYSEEGTFTVEAGKLLLTSSAEGATAIEATLNEFTIVASLKVSSMVPMATSITFYSEAVSGEFSATATTDGGVEYTAFLLLEGNTYKLAVGQDENNIVYACEGTFTIQMGMVNSLVLTATKVCSSPSFSDDTVITDAPDEVKTITAPVSEAGINASLIFDLDDSATLGFNFAK